MKLLRCCANGEAAGVIWQEASQQMLYSRGKADTSALDADTIVSADINGDAVADFQIQLNRAFKLTPTDSIL